MKRLRRDHRLSEERVRTMERENLALLQYKDNQNDTEVLMSALSAMQDKNTHLETSLSAETRVKLDLFSALGEAKRQLEISQSEFLMSLDVQALQKINPSMNCMIYGVGSLFYCNFLLMETQAVYFFSCVTMLSYMMISIILLLYKKYSYHSISLENNTS